MPSSIYIINPPIEVTSAPSTCLHPLTRCFSHSLSLIRYSNLIIPLPHSRHFDRRASVSRCKNRLSSGRTRLPNQKAPTRSLFRTYRLRCGLISFVVSILLLIILSASHSSRSAVIMLRYWCKRLASKFCCPRSIGNNTSPYFSSQSPLTYLSCHLI